MVAILFLLRGQWKRQITSVCFHHIIVFIFQLSHRKKFISCFLEVLVTPSCLTIDSSVSYTFSRNHVMQKWKEGLKWVYLGTAAYFSDIHFCQVILQLLHWENKLTVTGARTKAGGRVAGECGLVRHTRFQTERGVQAAFTGPAV